MKYLLSIFIATLFFSIILSSCRKKEPVAEAQPEISNEQAIEFQKHVNRYFHREVIPKFQQGWKEIRDSAQSVTYEYIYTRDRDRWIFSEIKKESSTLTGRNDSLALSLMSSAVQTTVFPIAEHFKSDSSLTLYWTWPVPFPEGTFDHTEGTFIALQNNGDATGGCDGAGTKARCKTCKCKTVCVGYQVCKILPNGCEARRRCASGGPFGTSMSNVIQ